MLLIRILHGSLTMVVYAKTCSKFSPSLVEQSPPALAPGSTKTMAGIAESVEKIGGFAADQDIARKLDARDLCHESQQEETESTFQFQ